MVAMEPRTTSQTQIAAQSIIEGISSGFYAPGEKLQEVSLSEKLGVSRNTLREAFALVAGRGLIERIPNRGVFIVEPSLEQLRDIYRARAVLEPGALRWGARQELDELGDIVATAEAARDASTDIDQVDIKAISDANQLFHRTIVRSADSPSLTSTMDGLLAQMRLAFTHATERDHAFHIEFIAQNRAVADLIADGEYEEAAELLGSSLHSTADNLARYFG